jgi:hypothetical protein
MFSARTDLMKLVDIGLLEKIKTGKALTFTASSDLKIRIDSLR